MDTIKLNSYYDNSDNVYIYYEFINYAEDLNAIVNFSYSKIEDCDAFNYNSNVMPKVIETLIPNKQVNIIQKHYFGNEKTENQFPNMRLFNLNDENNKETLKQNLRFNVSDPDDREPIKIKTDCINIANMTNINEAEAMKTTSVFINNAKIIFHFYLYDFYIYYLFHHSLYGQL